MVFFYDIVLIFYHLGIRLASVFSPKARAWTVGRRGQWERIQREMAAVPADMPVVWMHCASAGEFEQGRPILEKLREQPRRLYMVLSFYSPSGFEQYRETKLADSVYLLPPDGRKRSRRFLELIRPSMALFVKYEFWHHYLSALTEKGVPHFLVAGIFRSEQRFFKPWGGFFLNDLAGFYLLFVQDAESEHLLRQNGMDRVCIAGDPRVDRVLQLPETSFSDPVTEHFSKSGPTVVWGSSWPDDEELLAQALEEDSGALAHLRWIVVPHEPTSANVLGLMKRFSAWGIHRHSDGAAPEACRILVVDRTGLLSRLYRFAQFAYVGGGFGRGIHNILEPAAYGLPVLFGPRHQKFAEARHLLAQGGVFSVRDTTSLLKTIDFLGKDPETYRKASSACRTYLEKNRGAGEKIAAEALRFIFDGDNGGGAV